MVTRPGSRILLVAAILLCSWLGWAAAATAEPSGEPASDVQRGLSRCDSLHAAGLYDESVTLGRRLLARLEAEGRADSLAAADIVERILKGLIMTGSGGTAECLELAQRALALRERRLPAGSAAIGASAFQLGLVLERHGRYEEARALLERALSIQQAARPPLDPSLANTIVAIANLRARLGDYEGLSALYERALAIQERAHGPRSNQVAGTLQNYAILRKLTGDFGPARDLYLRALAILERELGPDHPRVARVHHNLGNVLLLMGDHRAARRAYERALAIREAALGPDDPQVASTLDALSLLLEETGQLVEARDAAERALKIKRLHYPEDSPRVAHALATLASILLALGDPAAAEPPATEALAAVRSAYGPEHPRVAELETVLGQIRSLAGDPAGAETWLGRALATFRKALSPDHPKIAAGLRSLAEVVMDRGGLGEARPLLEEALAIDERALGADNVAVAADLSLLGRLDGRQGRLAEARDRLERSVAITAATLGPDHPKHVERLALLARTLARSGDRARALELALRAEALGRRDLRLVARGLSERRALLYASRRPGGLDLALALAATTDAAVDLEAVWDEVVRSRCLVLDEMATRRRLLGDEGDEGIRRLRRELLDASGELAWLLVSSPEEEPERFRERQWRIQQRLDATEVELARRSADYDRRTRLAEVGLAEVEAALPPGSALVSYVRHPVPSVAGGLDPTAEPAPCYAALVLPADGDGPALVPLGPAAAIDLAVSRWRDEAGHGVGVPGRPEPVAERACREAGNRLREMVWDPVAPLLGDAERVFLVPDGSLHLVDFAALPVGEDGYLVESGPLLHCAGAERDLVGREGRATAPGLLLAMGAPDFDADCAHLVTPAEAATAWAAATGRRDATAPPAAGGGPGTDEPARRTLRDLTFAPLPASLGEVRAIAAMCRSGDGGGPTPAATTGGDDVLCLTGREASEAALKTLAGRYRILHLATHGFFLDRDGCWPGEGGRGVSATRPAAEPRTGVAPATDPLLLSGLALAGANTRCAATPREEDGVLLAAEIAALDLGDVGWAVLSACESGLGTIHADEGIMGLRRAFRLAGVPTVITSLWSIDDEMALAWMTELYRVRLRDGLGTAEAVRRADLTLLRRRREAGLGTHPYHWAGFVATGDWR